MLINYFFKISRLILVILNLAYIVAMLWIVYCHVVEDWVYDVRYEDVADKAKYPDTFYTANDMESKNAFANLITALYFSFTTLSTVGFGDYVPRTDDERITGIFILVFGVAIFSIIMGSFVEVLVQFKTLYEEFSDERLSTFFEIMKHFNNNQLID